MSHFKAIQRIMLVLNLITTFCLMGNSQSTYFVTPSGAGMMDGSSWNNASDDLQDMINTAIEGDQIWVAKGTYKPTVKMDFDNSGTADARETIFYINKNIRIYGGFLGGESQLIQRNWIANPTILSGDIGAGNNTSDNSYHVIYIDAPSAPITNNCILDGLYIRYGNANGSSDLHNWGGGLYLDGKTNSCKPTLHQLSIAQNSATYGGGLYCDADNGVCSPLIALCKIDSNQASKDGGGIYFQTNNGMSTSFVNNTQFRGNSATNYGGAVFHYTDQAAGSCTPEYSNCLFILNSAAEGGAIASENNNGLCLPTFRNVTFFNNSATMNSGAIDNRRIGGTCGSRFYNSILWANQNQIENTGGATVDLDHCIYDDGNPNNVLNYPNGVTSNGPVTDLDPRFRDQTILDLQVLPGSPAINGGDNNDIGTNITQDLDGKPRIIYNLVDIGPYENNCPMNNDPILVDIDASGDQIGTSWAHAFTDIQDGIDLACNCDTGAVLPVWVAEGTYYPTLKVNLDEERRRTFYITKNVGLFGGFNGTETTFSQRDFRTNEVILSGDIGIKDDPADNTYHVVSIVDIHNLITNDCRIDGFKICDGRASGNGVLFNSSGGGIYIQGNSQESIKAVLSNLIICNNLGFFGGGMNVSSAGPSILNCQFKDNIGNFGGGIANYDGSPLFENCIIKDNVGTIGGGFHNQGMGKPLFSNSAFVYNSADDGQPMPTFHGGAIFNDGTSPGSVVVVNSILWKNQDQIIQNNTAGTSLGYCIFDDQSPDGILSLPTGVVQTFSIDSDPEFLNLGSFTPPTEGRNLRLSQSSPAINSGFPLVLKTIYDLDGNNRLNGPIDIGPYENPYAGCPQTLTLDDSLYTPLNGTYQAQQSIQLGAGMEILNTAQVTLNAPEVQIDESNVQSGALLEVIQDGCTPLVSGQ